MNNKKIRGTARCNFDLLLNLQNLYSQRAILETLYRFWQKATSKEVFHIKRTRCCKCKELKFILQIEKLETEQLTSGECMAMI